jgi:dihydrofolate reductase
MRKIILNVAVSLDGLIEGPNGEYDWCFADQDYGMTEFMKSIDAIYYGRKSYELMTKSYQPVTEMEGGFSFPDVPGYVFSNSLKSVEKGYHLVSGDALSWIADQKKLPGKNIWLFGGAELTSSMLNAGLVDEMLLALHPIVLGEGKPLFSDLSSRIKLELMESKSYDSGLVSLKYAVKRNDPV